MAGEFVFKLIEETDIPLLHEWLNRPHVAEWWDGPISLADVRARYMPRLRDSAVKCYIVHVAGRRVGFIQSYRLADAGGGWWADVKDAEVYGIDQYLAEADALGRGIGRRMIRAFLHLLFADPAVSKVQVDPTPDNARAIRCYEAVGFRNVGMSDTPDGPAVIMAIDRESLKAERNTVARADDGAKRDGP